ncbi:MAG: substrate-binding domain-containing protein [Spirochaetales bacterium]|nr:substrate-binding domain-containing protein [Spirochaetales bacterium]MCF7938377.1 substrate-binding domain-containing protein [Spirochaetales bacterium]
MSDHRTPAEEEVVDPVEMSGLKLTQAEQEEARTKRFRIGVVLHNPDSDWSIQQLKGIRATLEGCNAELVDVLYSEYQMDKQHVDIDYMIKKNPDALVSIPIDTSSASADLYKQVHPAGIKLILMDNVPKDMFPRRDYSCYVSSDNELSGKITAELLSPYISPNGVVGIVYYHADFRVTDTRELSFKEWFGKHRRDVQIRDIPFLDYHQAGEAVRDFFADGNHADGLYVVWDEPALGVINNLRELDSFLPIVTNDLSESMALEISKGFNVKGVAAQRSFDQGVAEASAAVKALLGHDVPVSVSIPPLSVSRKNLLEAYRRIRHTEPPNALFPE